MGRRATERLRSPQGSLHLGTHLASSATSTHPCNPPRIRCIRLRPRHLLCLGHSVGVSRCGMIMMIISQYDPIPGEIHPTAFHVGTMIDAELNYLRQGNASHSRGVHDWRYLEGAAHTIQVYPKKSNRTSTPSTTASSYHLHACAWNFCSTQTPSCRKSTTPLTTSSSLQSPRTLPRRTQLTSPTANSHTRTAVSMSPTTETSDSTFSEYWLD